MDVHDAVPHNAPESRAEMLRSLESKLRPKIVRVALPDGGVLSIACEMTGASNEKMPRPVPTTSATVTPMPATSVDAADSLHASEVYETHDELVHSLALIRTLTEMSCGPKLRPSTVMNAPPLRGELPTACDMMGASNEKMSMAVPLLVEIVTTCRVCHKPWHACVEVCERLSLTKHCH